MYPSNLELIASFMRCICLNQNKWRLFLETSFKFWRLIWTSGSSSFCSVWFLILNKKQILFLVIKFPRTTFKYHSIVVFWCLALYQAEWLCQESLRDTIRSPFSLLIPLFVSCVWRLFLTKSIMKCSITKAWSISIYHFKAFIFTSPISRLGCNLC